MLEVAAEPKIERTIISKEAVLKICTRFFKLKSDEPEDQRLGYANACLDINNAVKKEL